MACAAMVAAGYAVTAGSSGGNADSRRAPLESDGLLSTGGVGLGGPTFRAPARGEASGSVRRAVVARYRRLPLAFEPNRGQFSRPAELVARGAGYRLVLMRSGRAALALDSSASRGRGATLVTDLVGARAVEGRAEGHLKGRVNYLIGDRSRWRTAVPTYSRVRYAGVWPGVNAIYHGSQGRLEYDFHVAAGADPSRIRLAFSGQRSAQIDRRGDLVLAVPGGQAVREDRPRTFQLVGGHRRPVQSAWTLRPDGRVGVRVGAYDHDRPLVIDPILGYSTYLGGGGEDNGSSITVDGNGNAYVAGSTYSADFPTTPGAVQTTSGGDRDAFVTKLNPAGSALVYSTYLGGGGRDTTSRVAVDASGQAYVGGETNSGDFPTTPGAFQTSYGGGTLDAFVAKLNAAGSGLVYATYLGGSDEDGGVGIAIDASGHVYGAGTTFSTDFPTTPGAFQSTDPNGGGFNGSDGYVLKLNAAGSALVYSTYLGGGSYDNAGGIALDGNGQAYVSGQTRSGDFPTTPGAFQPDYGGGINDGYVAKLNAAGSGLVYSTYVGGSAAEFGVTQVAVDASNQLYGVGYTNSSDFPTTPGAFQTSYGGGTFDAFAIKLGATGSAAYSTYLGGSADDRGIGIAIDASGRAYVVGPTSSGNFPTTPGALQGTYGGGSSDGYLTTLNPAGSGLVYSTYLGGGASEPGEPGVAVDQRGQVFATGNTDSSDFPTTPGAYQATLGGGLDAWVLRLSALTAPASKEECKNGGWKQFGFKSQGQCIAFVNHHR